MAIFHGTTDAVVAYANAEELTEQWCNINGADINADIHIPSFQIVGSCGVRTGPGG